jgi:hypothetical protein
VCAVGGYVSISVLLLLLWGARRSGSRDMCWRGYQYEVGRGSSVMVVSFEDGVITLATLIVSRMVSATQGAYRWGVPTFCAVCAVMRATTFDTCVGFVTVLACVSIVLTSCTLWDMIIVCARRFDVDDLILYSRYIVNVFIIVSWLKGNKEKVEWFLCQPMTNIDYVTSHVSQSEQFLSDVFNLSGVMEVFKNHFISPFFF